MWPNQSPEGAANSLHQTLYFLRSATSTPGTRTGNSVDYLVVEPDVVFLDPELVQVDSAAFFRQVSAALASDNIAEVADADLCATTRRSSLSTSSTRSGPSHGATNFTGFIWRQPQATADALIALQVALRLATDVVQRALAIDPTALDLESTLVLALHRFGRTAAAQHQYRHYATAIEDEHRDYCPGSASRTLVATRQSQRDA